MKPHRGLAVPLSAMAAALLAAFGAASAVAAEGEEEVKRLTTPESEVSALALDGKGNLYAGTAEASDKQPGVPGVPGGEGSKEKAGRPEGTGGVPIPAQPLRND